MGGYTKDFRNLLTILKNRDEKIAGVAAALKYSKCILGKWKQQSLFRTCEISARHIRIKPLKNAVSDDCGKIFSPAYQYNPSKIQQK